MLKRKPARSGGRISFSQYFQTFAEGDRVAVVRELAEQPKFPKQIQGRSGVVIGKRGSHYIIRLKDHAKEKIYVVHPVHLRKLQ